MSDEFDSSSSAQQKRRKIAKALLSKEQNVSVLAKEHKLTEKQAVYVEAVASGIQPESSARAAGYSEPTTAARVLEKTVSVREALEKERAKNAAFLGFSRRDVLEGISEAIDQAKTLADPMAQIAGWREVAKICGYYAPEVKKVELTTTHKQRLSELEMKSDQELLEIMLRPALDAEFSVVREPAALNPPS